MKGRVELGMILFALGEKYLRWLSQAICIVIGTVRTISSNALAYNVKFIEKCHFQANLGPD